MELHKTQLTLFSQRQKQLPKLCELCQVYMHMQRLAQRVVYFHLHYAIYKNFLQYSTSILTFGTHNLWESATELQLPIKLHKELHCISLKQINSINQRRGVSETDATNHDIGLF